MSSLKGFWWSWEESFATNIPYLKGYFIPGGPFTNDVANGFPAAYDTVDSNNITNSDGDTL